MHSHLWTCSFLCLCLSSEAPKNNTRTMATCFCPVECNRVRDHSVFRTPVVAAVTFVQLAVRYEYSSSCAGTQVCYSSMPDGNSSKQWYHVLLSCCCCCRCLWYWLPLLLLLRRVLVVLLPVLLLVLLVLRRLLLVIGYWLLVAVL